MAKRTKSDRQITLPLRHTPMPPGYRPDEPPCLDGIDEVYLDLETEGLDWAGTDRPCGWALTAGDRSYYLPTRHKGGGNLCIETVRRWGQTELRNKRIINQYLKFDGHMSRVDGVDLDAQGCTFHDIQHAEALLNDWEREFSLEAIAQRRLGTGKLDVGPKADLHRMPAWDAADYAKMDTTLVRDIHLKQLPLLMAEDLMAVMQLEDEVIPAVIEMEHNGVKIDVEKLHLWVDQSSAALDQMKFALTRKVGFEVNPDRTEDMVRLFKLRGIENPHRTATGAPSFPGAYVKDIPDEAVQMAYKIGKLTDLRNKFLIPYSKFVRPDGRIHGTFHQLMTGDEGTVSGRFSAVRPNLQQVMTPGKQKKTYGSFTFEWQGQIVTEWFIIKELFIPEGGVWFSADAMQIEYRLFGHYSAAKAVLAAYADNPLADYHQVICDMLQEYAPGTDRRRTKDVNFATIYGAGEKKIAEMLGMSLAAAREFLRAYNRMLPEAKNLLEQAMQVAERRGYVKTILGRRVRFPGKQRLHKSLNGIIQGGAADINKREIVVTHRNRRELGYTPRVTVHDELGGDLADAGMLPRFQSFLNEQHFDVKIPIMWDAHVGATWAAAKG